MNDTDLALIPIDDLVKEIETRCKTFVMAYELPDDIKLRNIFVTWFGVGKWKDAVGLSEILKNDCLNNYNGELTTLQRINEERDDAL